MADGTYQFGRFSLDLAEHRLSRDGQHVPLTPRVFAVLRVLVEHSGHLVEKELLLREVWNDAFVEEANLNRAVSVLRKALGESPAQRYVETVPKRGYRFIAPVVTLSKDAYSAPLVPAASRPPSSTRFPAVALAISLALVMVSGAAAYLAWNGRHAPIGKIGAPVHRQITFAGKERVPAVSPDGKWIAYVSGDSPQRHVIVRNVDGGEPVTVFSAPEASALRWSPDGADLVFWARGNGLDGLYIASAAGGARKIGAPGAFVTCWSPDGATIAVALFMRATVWSIRSDGTDQTKLLSANGEIFGARWAPGGQAFYYFNRADQTVSVFKAPVPRNGAAAEPVTVISGLEADGAFGLSADATRLVYARAPYYSNLWLVEAADGTTRPARTLQLTHGTSVVDRPRVSPNGQSIAFSMGYEWRTNVYTMPAEGGSPRQLTFFNALSLAAAWDPDGRALAFASTEGGVPRLWIVNADGTTPRPLAAADINPNYILSWAPGKRLLYQTANYRNFYVFDPLTGQTEVLLKGNSVGIVSSADASPDGKQLVLTWTGRPQGGLWLVNEDGEGARLLHELTNQSAFNPFAIGWSPDGTEVIAYDGRRAVSRGSSVIFGETITAAKILKLSASGGRPTTIVELPFSEIGGVAMFPDARRFVVSVYTSRSDVWVVDDFDAMSTRTAVARRYGGTR
jgi:Tol biopolymer transport system component/DNA-binding winged helix-turn-helix (wHTH) protein